jgi:hypothetical protein
MATLDEEWLGGPNKPIEELLTEVRLTDLFHGDTAMEVYDMITSAAGEIRALRLLVKNQNKRIDDLMHEVDFWEGEANDA